jgi:cellulose synthase/poly-beta-1,6-N-acetylglucosamine synthase-like glycosyltransferase
MWAARIFYLWFIVFFSYFVLLTLYYLFLVLVGILETEKRTEQDAAEDYATLANSSFSLDVSIIIPVRNEREWIIDSLKSVLNLNYPKFEVIVVDDGSTDNTMEALDGMLKLKTVDRAFVDHFNSGRVREIFESQKYPNVCVVSKVGGYKKAGAVNAGLNFAKSRYICVVDADTILEPDALLRVMAHVERDPRNVIGIGSYFGLVNGFKIEDGKIIERSFSGNLIVAYQNLEYIRTFIGNRTAWSKYNAMPNVAGGFGIWRRDIVMELGGYSTEFSCEDIELTFRVHDYIIEKGHDNYRILMLPYYAGWTEGPSNIVSLLKQRSRWQRVVNETIFSFKHMILSPKHRMFAFLTLPYFLLYEVLGVYFEILSIGLVIWAWFAGILQVNTFLAYFTLMVFSQIIISLLSLFGFARSQKIFKAKDILYLVVLSFFEFFWYRWLIAISKVMGTISHFQGVKVYDQYERQKRT